MRGPAVVPALGRPVALCRVADVPPGTMRAVRLDDVEPLAVYNVDGVVSVTADTCSHSQAFLTEGELEGDRVVCPAHWAEFDVRSGEALCFPATRPVTTYPARVEDGEVVIDLAAAQPGDGR